MKKLGGLPNKAGQYLELGLNENNTKKNESSKVFDILDNITSSGMSELSALRNIEKEYRNGQLNQEEKNIAIQQINEYYRSEYD